MIVFYKYIHRLSRREQYPPIILIEPSHERAASSIAHSPRHIPLNYLFNIIFRSTIFCNPSIAREMELEASFQACQPLDA